MNTETHEIVLSRILERKQRGGIPAVAKVAAKLIDASLNRSYQVKGWKLEYVTTTEQEYGDGYRYEMQLMLTFAHNSNQPSTIEYLALVRTINKAGSSAKVSAGVSWNVYSVDGEEYEELAEDDAPMAKDFVGYTTVEIPDNFDSHFEHLFGVEHQRDMMRSKLEASIEADWNSRYHTVLVGPPGCGKSDMAGTLKKMLGEEAVLEFDATSLTSAGVTEVLKDLPILPRVVILEEAEKMTSDQVGSVFLALMDQRGEIRKTTARQSIQRDAKLFCIATVNNYDKFKKLNSGALASRFGRPIYFNRPTRLMMEKILVREINKVDGNLAWINPSLDYIEKHNIQDTREIIDLCMCGAEMWLEAGEEDGKSKYEEMLDATSPAAVNQFADDEDIVKLDTSSFARQLLNMMQEQAVLNGDE